MPLDPNLVNRLVDKVKLNVGRVGDPTLNDYCIEYINNCRRTISNEKNHWFMRTDVVLQTIVGQPYIDLPEDFKDDDIVSLILNDRWIELTWVDPEDVRKTQAITQQGRPMYWYVDKMRLYLYPVPDQIYDVQLDYYRFLPDLEEDGDDTDELLVKYPEVMESYATAKAFRKLREWQDADQAMKWFQEEMFKLTVANADRELPDEFQIRPRSDVNGSGIRRNKGRYR